MCGIAGLVNLSGRFDRETMAAVAARMAGTLTHRGPDDDGVFVDPFGFYAFAQRRLSIIDLSPTGHQPMICEKTGASITFNGEIYNYQSLRPSLAAKGFVFHGSSDTEVLLNGLIDEGPDFLDKIDGMFAFGFFDEREKTLTLARDIFGEKPLYYTQTKDYFAFASELQALTVLPDFDTTIDRHRIATYLALQYLPAPLSIYKNAHKLPPGHVLTLTPDGKNTVERYFRFTASPAQTGTRSLDDLADELDEILSKTVRSRLFASDVPVGAFLSSGVDSSTVVALAMRHVQSPIKTFSIGFPDGFESEHKDAQAMAAHLRTEHYNEILSADFFDWRAHIGAALDEPNGDSSCLPTWAVSRVARKQVKVALSGDGGDELFGGYERYVVALQEATSNADNPNWNLGQAYYGKQLMIFFDPTLEKFIGDLPDETKTLLSNIRAPLNAKDKPALQRMRESDVMYYLPGAVLAKVDRMSMQHGLEVRSPLLGRRVADFAMRCAADDLCQKGQTKRVLKHLAARFIPRDWLDRPKKGFSIPRTQEWGRQKLAQDVAKMLNAPDCCLRAWVEPERLRRFADFHLKTPQTWHLWPVYILEQWLRHHPG